MKIQIIAMMKKTFLISCLVSVFAANAFADTHYVSYTGSDTYPYTSWATAADNIQSAVYAAVEGETVIVDNGTFDQGERIMVTNEITVRSKIAADMTFVDGGNIHGGFRIGTNSVVDGFTITNGNDGVGGGVMCWGGGTVENCIIGGNYASSSGGGVWIREGGVVRNCTISGNESGNDGGGVKCFMGGALLTNCVISDNWVYRDGGGVNASGGCTVRECTISRNSVAYGNGGGMSIDSGTLVVNSTISSNSGVGVFCNYGGVVSNCTIIGNLSLNGGGMYFRSGGEAVHCRFTGNIARYSGGGAYCSGGSLNLCIFTQNLATNSGGGIRLNSGSLNNSLIYDNQAVNYNGGGVDCSGDSDINNCTIVSNTAGNDGGGFYCKCYINGTNSNCIIYHNTTLSGDSRNCYIDYYYYETNYFFQNCCTTPTNNLWGSTGCIDSEPEFVDMYVGDFRLTSISPCINAGNNAYKVGNYDLDGNDRISGNAIDMGAYEYVTSPGGGPYKLFVQSENPSGIAVVASDDTTGLGGGTTTFIRTYYSGAAIDLDAPDSAGGNDFSYWLLDDVIQGGSKNLTLYMTEDRTAKAIYGAAGDVYYVSLNGTHTYPYEDWDTAATNIQAAVDAAASRQSFGATVLVTNGTYYLSSRIIVTNSVNVQSVNGAAVTHVNANRSDGCFLISDGTTLDGFTITNGYATGTGWEEDGGGVYCDEGGGVQNCVITGNESDDDGGGIFCNRGGTIIDCSLFENASGSDGGGVRIYYGGVVSNCIIMGNTATKSSNGDGGGVECYNGGVISHCTISDNTANDDGGGIWCKENNPCVVTLCIVNGNSAGDDGGGIYNRGATINNCAIFDNLADDGGGVICNDNGQANNCTITGNTASNKGGGVYSEGGVIHNSIVYFNSSSDGSNYYNIGTDNEYRYSCITPNPGGTGNITTAPEFVDKNSANYRLGSSSPCINQGNNSYAVGDYDLNGLPRIIDGTVDMGAYEYIGSQPGIHTLTVESQNPDSNVQIVAAPADNYGNSDGVTTFVRIYSNGVTVNLTAPLRASGNNFSYWLLDGVESETNAVLVIPMITNRIVKAVYGGGGAAGSLIPTNPVPANGEVDVPTYQLLLWQLATNGTPAVSCSSEIFNTAITPRAFSSEQLAGNQPLFTTVDNQDNAGTGNPDDDMDVRLGSGDSIAPIEFDISYTNSTLPVTAQLLIYAYDIDETDNEIDEVYFNGIKIGSLTGANNEWSTTVFDIDPSLVVQGDNLVKIEIAVAGGTWECTVDWGRLVINNESAGEANIRYAEQNKPVYVAGESVITSIDLDTIAASQAVKLEVNILEPAGTNIAGRTVNRTITGRNDDPFNVTLDLPSDAGDGVYHIQLLLYDISNQFQTLRMIPFGVGNADVITYDVFFGSASNDMAQIKTNLTYAGCFSGMLTKSADYWWQVIAKDASEQGTGSYWSFTTIGGGGNLTGDIYYVSLSGANTYPYTNWSTAANDIQSAVDAAAAETGAGAMVLVTNGTYILSSNIVVTNSLNVRSVNGAAVTIINGNRADKCFRISIGTILDGFTITNGYSTGTGWLGSGNGVHCDEGGIVQNCIIAGNESSYGGGIFCNEGGTIVNCSILGNAAYSSGGGIYCSYGGVVSNCIIKGNTATNTSASSAGGISCSYGGDITLCTIIENSAESYGGGIWNNSGTVNLCTISANRADDGGGIWCNDPCVVSLCTISGNSAVNRGGGIYNQNTTINNCVVVSNSADYGGGVMCQTESRLNNCTISGNEATTQGGGVYCYENCSVHNSIVYFNSSPEGPDYYSLITGNEYEYCCLTPDPGGTGNITTDPKFVDKNSDNYRLSSSSPCINQGNNSYAAGNYDINGLPRIIDGTVDMGAYEYIGSQPGIHTLTVESQTPDSNVQISISPADNYGNSDGVTTFVRIYSNGVTVNLTAPISAEGNNFSYWLLDGVESETNAVLVIPMITNRIVKAVYGGGGATGSLMPTNPVPANGEVDVPTYQLLLWQLATNGTPAVSSLPEVFNTAITRRAFSTEMLAGNQPLFTTVDNQDNAGTGNPDDDMDVSLGPGDLIAPIEFDILYTDSVLPAAVQLLIYAKDIDETEGEIDDVYFNGTKIGSLTGENHEWSTTVFDIDPSLVVLGNNLVKIEIAEDWKCTIDWGRLVINNESAGDANIRYAEQNKPVYSAGESVITSIDLDTIAASQTVKLEINILEPAGTNIAGTTVNRTLTGRDDDPFDVTLDLPGAASDGIYNLQLLLYDVSNQFQTLRMIPFGVGSADVITYDVFFGSASNDMAQIKTNLTYAGCFPGMLTENTDYWWQVIAKDASEQGTGSYWSFTTVGGTAAPAPPLNVTASDGTYTDRIIISWDASGGADKYRVFRDNTNIAEVTDISYSDMSVTLWQNYNYYVQAGNAVGWSANSVSNTGYAGNLSPPTGINASDGMFDDRIRITWNTSVGATKYQIYRDGRFVANVTDPTYDDMSVVQWQSYEYTVKAGNDYLWTPVSVDSDTGYAGNLAPPAGIAASDGTYANRVRITWNPSAGATSYRLYRDGIQIDEINGTSYDDMSVTLWQTYKYSVKAGNGLQWTPESNTDTGYAGDMAPPSGIAASDGTYIDRIRISWNASAGATAYRVYRDNVKITETSGSTYDDMNVVLWQTYNYSISAGNTSGWTPQSTNDSGYAGSFVTPANLTASDGLFSDRVRVTWNASSGATKYRIYRDDTQIAEITGTTYDDISVTAWQSYKYFVKAGNASGWTPSSISDTGYAGDMAPPSGVDASDGKYTDRVRVTWNASSGATKYRVFRNGLYLTETTGTTYDDTSVTQWQTYEYSVKAGNSSFWTPSSVLNTGYAGSLVPPDEVAASDGIFPDRVYITWTASPNAVKYSIHRDGIYLAETASTNYNDTTVTPWQTYEYCVKAGNISGWTPCSQADTGYAGNMAPPTDIAASDGLYIDRVRVTWNTSSGATKYQVFRDNLYIADTISTSFDDTTVLAWQVYTYTVKAGNSSFWTPHSKSDSGYAGDMAPPSGLNASDGLYTNKISITWNHSAGATKYELYRDNLYIIETTGTTYNDIFINPAQLYSYSVRAGNSSFWTPSSGNDSGYAAISAPADVDASDGIYSNMVRVTWSLVSGATSYKVYRGTTDVSTVASMIDESTSPYDDTSVKPAEMYYYWIKSSAEAGDSSFSEVDEGYAFKPVYPMVSLGKWKVKNGKKTSKISGKEIENLTTYLTDGCLIGIRDKDSTNIIDGPRVLEAKVKKKTGEVKFWFFKLKKNAVIKYKVKKSKLIYKIWKNFPINPVIFLVPSGTSNNLSNQSLEFYLEPIMGQTNDIGWQDMKSIVVEPEGM